MKKHKPAKSHHPGRTRHGPVRTEQTRRLSWKGLPLSPHSAVSVARERVASNTGLRRPCALLPFGTPPPRPWHTRLPPRRPRRIIRRHARRRSSPHHRHAAGRAPQGKLPTPRGTPSPARHAHRDHRMRAGCATRRRHARQPPTARPASRSHGAADGPVCQWEALAALPGGGGHRVPQGTGVPSPAPPPPSLPGVAPSHSIRVVTTAAPGTDGGQAGARVGGLRWRAQQPRAPAAASLLRRARVRQRPPRPPPPFPTPRRSPRVSNCRLGGGTSYRAHPLAPSPTATTESGARLCAPHKMRVDAWPRHLFHSRARRRGTTRNQGQNRPQSTPALREMPDQKRSLEVRKARYSLAFRTGCSQSVVMHTYT